MVLLLIIAAINVLMSSTFPASLVPFYRGADKSLALPGRKQATFPAFYGTWRFITTFTTDHHLSLP